VFLAGIMVRECARCDVGVPIIPNIAQLHGLITERLLLKNGLLTGEEIRFLRKNAGLSGKNFARYIEIHPLEKARPAQDSWTQKFHSRKRVLTPQANERSESSPEPAKSRTIALDMSSQRISV
jgi:hypothetical protein